MNQRAILVRSPTRFEAFKQKLTDKGVSVTVIDFDDPEWVFTDFDSHDFLIYYPSFERVSAHPLSLSRVRDHLNFIAQESPGLALYPDVNGVYYYGDKYRQHLHLTKHGFPAPKTVPLYSPAAVELAAQTLGFPMVVKNRFGAGGDYVLLVENHRELDALYRQGAMDYSSLKSIWSLAKSTLLRREFYYWWLKRKELNYPFLSHPLLAQKFQPHERDLKVVIGDGVAVEAHWRGKAKEDMWKVNIDGGGVGVWSHVPDTLLEISIQLAQSIGAKWLNVDLFDAEAGPLISEFSPVWHHYRYAEKSSFIYEQDYDLEDLKVALDLEEIIVRSFVRKQC